MIGYAVDSFLSKRASKPGPGIGYMVTTFVLDLVLGFAAAMVVAWFSASADSVPTLVRPSCWATASRW